MKFRKKSPQEIEKQLLPRLRFMGFLLMIFGVFTFCYGLFLDPPSPINTPEEKELASGLSILSADGRVNAFGIASIFSIVGASCVVIALKRRQP